MDNSNSVLSEEMKKHDAAQVAMMEECLIVVDQEDNPIGVESKKTCHLMSNILPPRSLLHRAFSCFLFRPSDGKLLLQKRASEKITFPDLWTNTCCSHPLAKEDEMETADHIGIRRAAQRKLEHELGIQASQVPLSDFVFLTRIHYLAPSDGLWGEHEIDYIFFITAEVDLEVNPNECSDVAWVSQSELQDMLNEPNNAFTPWFKLIVGRFLFPWWKVLLERSIDSPVDARVLAEAHDKIIHRMNEAKGADKIVNHSDVKCPLDSAPSAASVAV
ncbi:NUDIX hydrolase domain-like protein [Melampsora americana]|nr:NUDIX hydrolase domain-like protein [Melampsora americana]